MADLNKESIKGTSRMKSIYKTDQVCGEGWDLYLGDCIDVCQVIEDDFIVLQSGAWDISNKIIEPNRIQAITTSQLFWHKNINIGSLTLHTAGGNIAFQLGDFEKIKQYVNLWLYRLEKSDSNWM